VSAFIKPTVTGIEIPVQAYQKFLYLQIKQLFAITSDTDFDFYGLAYRNQTDDGYSPEFYVGKSDYQELYFDDTKKMQAFFGVQENRNYQRGGTTAKVFLIFMVDLLKLKGTDAQMLDEQVRNAILKLVAAPKYEFRMTGFRTGIDQVFSEYSGWRKVTGIKYKDQFPRHCFRIDFDVVYDFFSC
jgi:hypothetical protein